MGNIFNAVGALVEGRQQANELRNQAELQKREAEIGKENAAITARQAGAREEQLRRSARQALGAQRAAIAESGTGFGGSNQDIVKQSTANAELDALNIRYAGTLERVGILNQVAINEYNHRNLRNAAKTAMKMRWFNAASALFMGKSVGTQPSTAPTLSSGSYGQGSTGNFGNNVQGFQSTGSSSKGFTGYGLSGGYGSVGGYTGISGGG